MNTQQMDIKSGVTVPDEELARQKEYEREVRELLHKRYPDAPPLAFVHSYGCQQNVSDGEKLKGQLAQMGYGFCDSPEGAKLILYNTCAVRENAEDRVFGNVGALKKLKKQQPDLLIGLCGCMTQQQQVADKIKQSYPYVDLVFGTHALHRLPELLYQTLTGNRRVFQVESSDGMIAEGLPVRRDSTLKANLPVMYGCNNFCTYCIVPHVRGRERSRDPEAVLAEARQLVEHGYKEITLLGQNVNSYGKDLSCGVDFAGLLRRINDIPGEFVIRFMTSHPRDCTRELIDAIAQCEKVCNHIHLPVQSGCNRVLQAMNRHYVKEDYKKLIDYARAKIPDVIFTSDIIVGFPGERYEEFLETLELIKAVRYHALFTFIYSPRVGTKAASMDDPVPAEEKGAWFRELLAVQQDIGLALFHSMEGQTQRVLVEGESRSDPGRLTGRNYGNILVEFPGDASLIGSFADVTITGAKPGILFGELKKRF